jgi:predicted AAA+ superfamily ATPase
LVHLAEAPLQFAFEFGLDVLPREPGVILVRGPRQYGKSTWLEQQVLATVRDFGPGTAFYLNGDVIPGRDGLLAAVRDLVGLFRPGVPVKRLFIDEVTAIDDWQKSIKALVDGGALRDVLVVTTGSKAADLRRASERLPGRKGRLARTLYLFTPISYREFHRLCGARLGDGALAAYLLSGGAPIACSHVAMGRLPEHVVETVKDWVYGECAASGRGRSPLLAVLQCLARWGGVPLGQAKLAREAGLANNTVAAGYLELLADLMCVGTSFAWEASRGVKLRRKEAKFHFCNTLVAAAWHPAAPRSVGEIQALSGDAKGAWFEWGVAQELWRRAAIRGDEFPEETAYWRSKEHEIDFVVGPAEFLEVKAGPTNPLEFAWFGRVFPGGRLRVLGRSRWETAQVQGILHEDFFLAD